jgi:hypothetical protein
MLRSAPHPLRSADLTLLGEYADAIDGILALIARRDLPADALRSGIRHLVTERLPSPGSNWVRPGSTWGEVAVMIADRLRSRPGPATTLLAEIARENVWMRAGEFAETLLDDEDDARSFGVPPGTPCWHRPGQFLTGAGNLVADTGLDLIPRLIPPGAMARIRAGEPCGPVLAAYGMRREAREADPTGGDPAVEATAWLRIGEVTVGRAAEKVPLSFCQRVAADSRREG